MSETYQPYFESTSEKEDDKKEGKKDQKKRAAQAELQMPKPAEHASGERPQKLGGELLRPLAIELPKKPESEAESKQKERESAEPQAEAPAATSEELRHEYDELLAAVPEAADDDDDRTTKSKKRNTEAKAGDTEAPEPEHAGHEPADTEAAFQGIVSAPELADIADLQLPESPAVAESVAHMPYEMPAAPAPEVAAGDDPDADSSETVVNASGEDVSGESPVDTDAGSEEPPLPPTAEGSYWDDEPWGQPAGGLGAPATREAINAVDNRRELDDLYHTSRENGLAGAVGIIGLGLILEHFAAKRRDKKLKRQLDAQHRQLRRTDQALRLEQRSNQSAQQKLERLQTTQITTSEQLRGVTTLSIEKSAEIAAAAAAGSVIGRAAERGKTKITPAQEKVLAERLEHSRELGRAIKRNPELKDVYDLKQSLEVAADTAQQQEQHIDGLKREVSYEHLQRKQADADRSPRVGGSGATVDSSGMPVLPLPQQQLTSGLEPDHLLEAHAHPDKRSPINGLTWVALATVLVIVAAVIVMVYIR